MEMKHSGTRYVVALACAVLFSLGLCAAGLFLAGAIGDAIVPDFGYEFQGLEWLAAGAVVGALVGSLLGAWLVLHVGRDRVGVLAVIYVAALALALELIPLLVLLVSGSL